MLPPSKVAGKPRNHFASLIYCGVSMVSVPVHCGSRIAAVALGTAMRAIDAPLAFRDTHPIEVLGMLRGF